MGPKVHHRTTSSSRLGPHSRNTSATRLAANLQFTQKDPQHITNKQAQSTQNKKNNHGRTLTLQRVNSSHRIASKDQLPPFQPAPKRPAYTAKTNGAKLKRGFIIASSPSDEADDDEWVSSESGAATPNFEGSGSGADSELVAPVDTTKLLERRSSTKSNATTKMVEEQDKERLGGGTTPIPRVDIARLVQALDPQLPRGKLPAETELELSHTAPPPPPPSLPAQNWERRISLPPMVNSAEPSSIDNSTASRPSHKRRPSTRPPSTHSISSRHETLRPHPLIRGQSFGLPANKLAPLTMTSDVASAQLSSTPPANIEQTRYHHPSPLSSSPATTISGSPPSPSNPHYSLHQQLPSRRTSISSARSVATLPAHSLREPPRQMKDRNRTISTISTSSSSAAISSLAHIPATRPSSPQRLSVMFPPPSHPQFHTAGVHSLLPPPYLTNHLTTLAHRTPLRESYDRVRHAKIMARR
ncbi:hypothetical protein J3R30DRAFT_3831126 [Lentinula aciculospora]|uniref:Uncharacterized protein n=1 Tax=Lentinula aciculospora TaxID=153920 RepID=A0A9W9DFP7_9AGAR|nr:hypothetical protein J3R30DRAFT_3831126 [Lentinula aciculospora]